ncbi:MAG: hypothetical protein II166_04715 [Firmicutes bacterium]|nr:hypothetical protein [Bacillota bacterium]
MPAAAVFVLFIAGTLMNGRPAPLDGAPPGDSQGEARTGQTELVNPFRAVDSAEDLKAMLGIDVRLPEGASYVLFSEDCDKQAVEKVFSLIKYFLNYSSKLPDIFSAPNVI